MKQVRRILDARALKGRSDLVLVRDVTGNGQGFRTRLMVLADHGPDCGPPKKEAVVALLDPESEEIRSRVFLLRNREVRRSCVLMPDNDEPIGSWAQFSQSGDSVALASVAEALEMAVRLEHNSVAVGPFADTGFQATFRETLGSVPFNPNGRPYEAFDQPCLAAARWRQFTMDVSRADFHIEDVLAFLGAQQIRLYWDSWVSSFKANPLSAASRFITTTRLAREDFGEDSVALINNLATQPSSMPHPILPYKLLHKVVSTPESKDAALVVLNGMKHHIGFLLACLRTHNAMQRKGRGLDPEIATKIDELLHDKLCKTREVHPELLRMIIKQTTSEKTENLAMRMLARNSPATLFVMLGEITIAPGEFAGNRLTRLRRNIELAAQNYAESRRSKSRP